MVRSCRLPQLCLLALSLFVVFFQSQTTTFVNAPQKPTFDSSFPSNVFVPRGNIERPLMLRASKQYRGEYGPTVYTVRVANSALMLVVAVALLVLKKPSALAWWVGFGMHALLSSIMRRFPFPTTIPESFRREARSNLAKSYIAQGILLSVTFTSESLVPRLVSRYLLFTLIFMTTAFFDWPDPPLLERAPALVFPGGVKHVLVFSWYFG